MMSNKRLLSIIIIGMFLGMFLCGLCMLAVILIVPGEEDAQPMIVGEPTQAPVPTYTLYPTYTPHSTLIVVPTHIPTPRSTPIPTPDCSSAVVESGVTDYADEYGYHYYVGEVINNTSCVLEFVKVIVTEYDETGNVIGVDSSYTETDRISPGEKSAFEIMTEMRPNVSTYRLVVTWNVVK